MQMESSLSIFQKKQSEDEITLSEQGSDGGQEEIGMKFVIEHLSKAFGPKEVLRDIDFSFEFGPDLRPAGAQRRR